jgi:hypothetical protein
MTSAERIAEQEARGDRRGCNRIGQTIWVVVRARVIEPSGHTALQDLGNSAPTRDHGRGGQGWRRARGDEERRRGQVALRGLCARSYGKRRNEERRE